MRPETDKFFRKLFCFLPLLGLVLGFNVLFDATHLLGWIERMSAARGAQGETMIADPDEDDRLVVRARVDLMRAPYDVIVLGSSRSLQIYGGLFRGKTFFNASVLGADLRDQIALYELLREQGRLPKVLVLSAEPQLVQTSSPTGYQARWLTLEGEYDRAMARLGMEKPAWDSLPAWTYKLSGQFQILSPVLFQESLKRAVRWSTSAPPSGDLWDMEHPHDKLALRMPDRALVYSQNQNAPTQAEIQASLTTAMGYPNYGPNQRLDADAQHEFETFVRTVRADGVELIFFLPPFHPLYMERLKDTKGGMFVDETQKYYNTLARELDIAVVGSFYAESVGCAENDFYDATHPLARCVSRIWRDAVAKAVIP